PFSHDAQSDPSPTGVSEPATLLLLGLGLIGVAGYARRDRIRVRSNPRFR
ncbi:MAG: PEP-CTERM sorting domain-containing protein, partial [Proteobacteria bacterium]|nr:PEP-CTERM sorting domain-containing protein [Pseudomonadota bacterium]